jgi:hypothetical protein
MHCPPEPLWGPEFRAPVALSPRPCGRVLRAFISGGSCAIRNL